MGFVTPTQTVESTNKTFAVYLLLRYITQSKIFDLINDVPENYITSFTLNTILDTAQAYVQNFLIDIQSLNVKEF